MPSANARHILVSTEVECLKLKEEIENGADFDEVAKLNSACPSRVRGGDLGTFSQGQMVPEFDQIVFSGELNKVLARLKPILATTSFRSPNAGRIRAETFF